MNLAGVERSRIERGRRPRPPRRLACDRCDRGADPSGSRADPRAVAARARSRSTRAPPSVDARIRLYGASSVSEDGAFARIRLSSPLVLDVHDRFVLRESGRRETVAGGVVLDPAPPQRPGATAADRLERREKARRADIPALLLAERGAVREAELRSADRRSTRSRARNASPGGGSPSGYVRWPRARRSNCSPPTTRRARHPKARTSPRSVTRSPAPCGARDPPATTSSRPPSSTTWCSGARSRDLGPSCGSRRTGPRSFPGSSTA